MTHSTDKVQIKDYSFIKYIDEFEISALVRRLSNQIEAHYEVLPLFLPVLNGAYIFMADLSRELQRDHRVEFIKYQSYDGMESKGLKASISIPEDKVIGQHICIVEDIVDRGHTLDKLRKELQILGAKQVDCVAAFYKPDAYAYERKPEFIGLEIPDKFVIGYGMDYDGQGRGLKDLYQLEGER